MWNPLQAAITALTDINKLFFFLCLTFFCFFPAFVGVWRLHVILTHCEEVRNELAVSLQGGWGSRLGVSLVFSPVRITHWSSLSPLRIAMDDGGSMELEVQVSTELWKPRRSPVDKMFLLNIFFFFIKFEWSATETTLRVHLHDNDLLKTDVKVVM